MPTNVEIKAKLNTEVRFEETKQLAQRITDQPMKVIPQEDTFFFSACGRLKLRVLSPDHGQLVFYDRVDTSGPKRSFYSISETKEPEKLKVVLEQALGVKGEVKKVRYLYMAGQTRIHLDKVQGLGYFLELEVVMNEQQTTEEGKAIADNLMHELQIQPEDLLEGAYMDILQTDAKTSEAPKSFEPKFDSTTTDADRISKKHKA